MPNASVISYMGEKPKLASSVFLASGARLIGNITADEGTSFWFNVSCRADVHYIKIGKNTNIQDNTVVHVTSNAYPTIIGNHVTIGHNAIIHACEIEDESLIGMGACILDGAIISKHCFLAAGSLVSPGKKYPEGSLLMGRPAKVIKKLSAKEISKMILDSSKHYLEIKKNYEKNSTVLH